MDKRLLQLFCFFNLSILICPAEHRAENIHRLDYASNKSARIWNNFRKTSEFKKFSPLDSLQFIGAGEDFTIQVFENLLQSSSKCLSDILYTFQNIESQWAFKLFDSFGKPESGVVEGNFKWVGNYRECIGVRASNPRSTTVGNFRGKYCSLSWLMSFMNFSTPFNFSRGICVPDSCSENDLQEDILQLLGITGVIPVFSDTKSVLSTSSIKCKPLERHLNTPAKAVIALLSLFCALTVLGSSVTAVKYFKKTINKSKALPLHENFSQNSLFIGDETSLLKEVDVDNKALFQDDELPKNPNVLPRKLETLLGCFCIFTNGGKILKTDSSADEVLCLHGIRFLSMCWVILEHSVFADLGGFKNSLVLPDITQKFISQFVAQGVFAVDSFFVLSGFLLAYLCMKQFAKNNGRVPWTYLYIHRYLRLTPMYMIILGFSATVYLYLGSGPFWPDHDLDPRCRDNWWRNLLYINNFSDKSDMCLLPSWYLANDMQFFVISPLFLILLWRRRRIGYALLAVCFVASWASGFFMTYRYELTPGLIELISHARSREKYTLYFNKFYTKPYTRIAPYLIGIITGYLLFKKKATHQPKHSLVFLCIGWIVSSVIMLTCVFGLYHRIPSVVVRSFYNALSPTGFALGVSWVIYVCLKGQGGFVKSFLSFKLFIPLSRLTYAAYLVHMLVIEGYFASLKTPLEFSQPTATMLYLGFLVTTYALALPVTLMFESPVISLEKLMRRSFSSY